MDLFLEIVTPDKTLFEGNIGLVEIPGSKGKFTILKNHAPIISSIDKGEVRIISKDGREQYFGCEGGIVECKNNKITILIDKAF